jgi:23S rRNA pseudouridine1911/1915/1917 synthase
LSGIGGVLRPGIVHRLDAGTSGVLVVAKNDRTHRHLQKQFQRREVEKIYVALVYGETRERFTVDTAIGRDERHRTKISSRTRAPRAATSEVTQVEKLPLSSLLSIRIRTGRTHQIRVHLSEAGHPVVGDRHYGAPRRNTRAPSRKAAAFRLLRDFPRPALHARVLGLRHPRTEEPMRWEAPLADDLQELLTGLRELAATCAS